MTEIEAKALALVNEHALNRRDDLLDAKTSELHCALLDAVQAQATTEARHAAEMRELKERFSEVLTDWFGRYGAEVPPQFHPFIIPAPDPLVEAWQMAFPGNHIEDARDECAKISAAIEKRGGKIVWEAGE